MAPWLLSLCLLMPSNVFAWEHEQEAIVPALPPRNTKHVARKAGEIQKGFPIPATSCGVPLGGVAFRRNRGIVPPMVSQFFIFFLSTAPWPRPWDSVTEERT